MSFHAYPNRYVQSVTLKVSNLEKSLLFYKDIIGLTVEEKTINQASLKAGTGEPFLYLEELSEVEKKNRRTTGLYHFAILVPSREELGSVLKHLLKTGYPLQGASDHSVSEAIYLADPDGNGIEIYRDRDSDEWDWEDNYVQMDTLQMDAEGVLAAGRNLEWKGLSSGTILGHIHLHVADLKETIDFYVKGLEFDIVLKYGSQAYFLSTGSYHHHIGLNVWNGIGAPQPEKNHVGLKYYDIIIPNNQELQKVKENLSALGVNYKEENGVIIANDPSGNTVRLRK